MQICYNCFFFSCEHRLSTVRTESIGITPFFRGRNALHLAEEYKHQEVVEILRKAAQQ